MQVIDVKGRPTPKPLQMEIKTDTSTYTVADTGNGELLIMHRGRTYFGTVRGIIENAIAIRTVEALAYLDKDTGLYYKFVKNEGGAPTVWAGQFVDCETQAFYAIWGPPDLDYTFGRPADIAEVPLALEALDDKEFGAHEAYTEWKLEFLK